MSFPIFRSFPTVAKPEFQQMRLRSCFVVAASSHSVHYDPHDCTTSIKCAFGGGETYYTRHSVQYVHDEVFLIVNQGKVYSSSIRTEQPVESFTVNFPPVLERNVLASMMNPVHHLLDASIKYVADQGGWVERLYPHDMTVTPVLQRLRNQVQSGQTDTEVLTEITIELLEAMVRLRWRVEWEISKIKAVRNTTRQELYRRLYHAKDFLDSCYRQPLTNAQCADLVCMDLFHFLRSFRTLFGVTPRQYIIGQRLRMARHLLATTAMTVTEVCLHVGYDNPSSFARLYRNRYGVSPEQGREAKQGTMSAERFS